MTRYGRTAVRCLRREPSGSPRDTSEPPRAPNPMKGLKYLPVVVPCTLVLGALVLAASASFAQEGRESKGGVQTPEEAKPQSTTTEQGEKSAAADSKVLHESMEALEKSMRSMRRLMNDPDSKDEALAMCAEMEAQVLVALQHPPAPHGELEGQTLVEYHVAFKRRMLDVYGTILDLAVAVEKGDHESATTAFRSLGQDRREGHQTFISEEGQQRNRRRRRGRNGGERGGERGGRGAGGDGATGGGDGDGQ